MSATNTTDDASRGGRARVAAIALLVGFILGVGLLIILTGNPLSSANEVRFVEVTVGSVSDEEDSLCWSDDPDERDASRQCAILAIDPQATVPAVGESLTLGIVDIAPPGTEPRTQIVYTAPTGAQPTEAATTPSS